MGSMGVGLKLMTRFGTCTGSIVRDFLQSKFLGNNALSTSLEHYTWLVRVWDYFYMIDKTVFNTLLFDG